MRDAPSSLVAIFNSYEVGGQKMGEVQSTPRAGLVRDAADFPGALLVHAFRSISPHAVRATDDRSCSPAGLACTNAHRRTRPCMDLLGLTHRSEANRRTLTLV